MPCSNHPAVMDGLSPCTRCAKAFCIDCLVGRPTGWFCATCDAVPLAPPGNGGGPPAAPPVEAPAPGGVAVAPSFVPRRGSCVNHPEIMDDLNACALCAEKYCSDCLVELQGRRFCAGCKVEAVKDIQSGVDSSGMQLATIGARFAALIIDNLAINVIIVPGILVLGLIMGTMQPNQNSAAFPLIILGFYGVILGSIFCYHGFMLQWKGQTLGKMAMKIKVVTPEGGPITAGQAWIRVFVWFLLQGCLIDYIPAFFNPEKLAIHDMAAKTRVVKIG